MLAVGAVIAPAIAQQPAPSPVSEAVPPAVALPPALDRVLRDIVGGYRYPQSTGPGGRFVLAPRMGAGGRWHIAANLDNSGPRP